MRIRRFVSRLGLAAVLFAGALLLQAQEVPQKVKDALKRADDGIAQILAIPDKDRTFENTVAALDRLGDQLDRDTSLTLFMQFVSTSADERDAARAAEEAVSNWAIEVGKREDLYKAVKAYADTNPKLEGEQKRLLEFTMRDYRRAGMTLPADKRERLKQIEMELQKLGTEFETNINEDESKVALTEAELKGVPKDVVERQKRAAGMIMVGLDGPSYGAVMDYCQVPTTRQKMWIANRRRGGAKNVRVLEKLLKLRAEQASILGYKNSVDYVVETRMAKNSETIKKFYEDLTPLVQKKAKADFDEFLAAKRADLKNPKATFDPWDYAYYKNKLLLKKYAVDSEKVSEYLPMESVVKGLFDTTSQLYNIEYRDVTAKAKELGLPIWHEDVKLYEVVDKGTGKLIGRMYTDLYPRDNKYSHAACWGLQHGNRKDLVPLAALVCNFTKPTKDKPSLLPHDEVETFFHEFGHGLHNMFAQTEYPRFSGSSVARDFVEAPSQMMENWVWSPEILKTFAKHYKTGEVLPEKMLQGMKAAQTLGSGIETAGQMFLGTMDQAFHTAKDGQIDTTKTSIQIYNDLLPYAPVEGNLYPQAAFGHLVGYEGAYYGYLWSLVFAQDMFQRFEELGLTSPKAGEYYREKILGRGGSIDEMQMLRDYLGREPKMDAFLKHLGLGSK